MTAKNLLTLCNKFGAIQNPHRQGLIIWKELFGVKEDDPDGNHYVLKAVTDLIGMTYQIESQLRDNPATNNDLYLSPIQEIKTAFLSNNLYSSWSEFASKIPPHTIRALAFVVHELEKEHREDVVSAEELNEIRESVQKLYSDISRSDIDKRMRAFLLQSLNQILNAMNSYYIFGADGIKNSIATTLGNVFLEGGDLAKSSEKEKGFLDQTMAILSKTAKIVKIYKYGKLVCIGAANEIIKIGAAIPV